MKDLTVQQLAQLFRLASIEFNSLVDCLELNERGEIVCDSADRVRLIFVLVNELNSRIEIPF